MKFVVSRIFLVGMFIVFECLSLASATQEMTWQDCLREAAKNHPDLIAAQEGIVQKKADKTIAASGGLPQVTANASASNIDSKNSGNSNSFSYGVSGTQLLFDGLKTVNGVNAASENLKAAKESYKFTSATVRFRLREAFIDLLKAQEQVNLTEEILKIRKSNVDLIELRYQSGTEHKGALLTAQANVTQAEYEVNQAKRGLETAQQELTKELGREDFSALNVTGKFEVSDVVKEEPNFEQLADNNPSFLKIVAQKNASAFDLKSSKGDFLPTISVNGGISESGNEWEPKGQESSAGVRVSLPLFAGGENVANLQKAKSVYRELEQQQRSVKDGVILNLRRGWNAMQDAAETVQVQKDFLNAAEERAKIAEQQYSVGLISFDNWTIIEDDLVRNKKSYLNAQADALLAEASWIQDKGETLEYEN